MGGPQLIAMKPSEGRRQGEVLDWDYLPGIGARIRMSVAASA